MADYPYEQQIVFDPDDPENIVRYGQVWLYDPADTAGTTPLVLKDPDGLPLPQPLTSNRYGFIGAFIAPVPQVLWKSGGFENYFNSFIGLLEQATAAVAAADAAADAASDAATAASESAQAALGPTDEQVDAAVRRASHPSNLALATDGVPYILPGADDIYVYQSDDGNYYFTTA